jgi:hypothetical protein
MPKKPTNGKPTMTPRKKADPKKPISITIEPQVLAWVDERADVRSEQINGDLARYYRLLAEIRPTLRERFSPEEISLILDSCNGWMMDFSSPQFIWANVADSIRLNQLDQKWGVSKPDDLVQRLRGLSLLESIALADAITRWWHAVGEGDHTRDPARALD